MPIEFPATRESDLEGMHRVRYVHRQDIRFGIFRFRFGFVAFSKRNPVNELSKAGAVWHDANVLRIVHPLEGLPALLLILRSLLRIHFPHREPARGGIFDHSVMVVFRRRQEAYFIEVGD